MTTPDLTQLSLQRLSDFDSLRRLARAIVGEDHADDVVQEAWAAALSHDGAAPDSWPRWMTRVTQRIAWKRRVQSRNRRDREHSVRIDEVVKAPDELIAEIEEKQMLERALLELDEPYRSALLMRYYGDLPVGEVARRAGTPESTTRTHVQRGLKQLRDKLEAERGMNWSAALLPFLLPKPSGAKAATTATLKGLSLLTAMKIVSATLLGLLLAGYGITRFIEPSGALSPSLVTGVSAPSSRAETPRTEATPMEAPTVPDARNAEVASAPAPLAEPELKAARPAAASGTVVRLVGGSSGRPLAGVGATVHYAGMKRGFFTSHTETRTLVVESDSQGMVDLPFQVGEDGMAASNSVTFELDLGPFSKLGATCRFLGTSQDGHLEFALASAHCAWVVLPEALSAEEHAALSATWTLNSPRHGSQVQYGRVTPVVATDERLLFVLPAVLGISPSLADTEGVLHIATTSVGRSFHATLSGDLTLAAPPISAVRAHDITHGFKVTDASSGAALKDVRVAVSSPIDGKFPEVPYLNTQSRGTTDAVGHVELIGIPAGKVCVYVDQEGYEPFRERLPLAPGGKMELRLRKKADLRAVSVVITGTQGDPPMFIQLDVLGGEQGRGVVHKMFHEFRPQGEGWRLEETLENVPGELAFLTLHVMAGSYDAPSFVRLEPGETEVAIALGDKLKQVPVILRLPAGVKAGVTYRFDGGRLTGAHEPLASDATVVMLPTDGRAWTWMVDVEGYVPVMGTEANLRPSEFRGKPCLDLVPELREGWGTVVDVQERGVPDDRPFSLWVPKKISGVSIVDPRTDTVLGVTNDRGHVVIEAPEPIMELTARYGDKEQTFEFKGSRSVSFGL